MLFELDRTNCSAASSGEASEIRHYVHPHSLSYFDISNLHLNGVESSSWTLFSSSSTGEKNKTKHKKTLPRNSRLSSELSLH